MVAQSIVLVNASQNGSSFKHAGGCQSTSGMSTPATSVSNSPNCRSVEGTAAYSMLLRMPIVSIAGLDPSQP